MTHRLPVALLLLCLTLASSHATRHTAFAATPVLAVAPATTAATVGEEIAIDITVANVDAFPGLGGYALALHYNPAVLEMTVMADSGFVTGGDNIVVCGVPAVDNAQGLAQTFCQALPLFSAPGVSTVPPVALVKTTFKAKAAGTSDIGLADSYLESPQRVQLSATLTGGSVTVSAAAPQATATPAATGSVLPAASPTSTSTPGAAPSTVATTSIAGRDATRSTNGGGGTLSNVEAPGTGSGNDADASRPWIFVAIAAGGTLVGIGGFTVWRHWQGGRQ